MQPFFGEPLLKAKVVPSNLLTLLAEDLDISDEEMEPPETVQQSNIFCFKKPAPLVRVPKVKRFEVEKAPKLLVRCGELHLPIPDFNLNNVFDDVSKMTAVERYFDVLYRPSVCYLNTKCMICLEQVDLFLTNTSYNSNKHPALIARRSKPICNLKVYANGVIYCESVTANDAYFGLMRFLDELDLLGYTTSTRDTIHNKVSATFAMPFHLNLQKLHLYCVDITAYCPNTRSFLTYKIPNSLVRLAVFANGFVYVLFSKRQMETRNAIAYIIPILFEFALAKNSEAADLRSGDIDFRILWENAFQSKNCRSLLNA